MSDNLPTPAASASEDTAEPRATFFDKPNLIVMSVAALVIALLLITSYSDFREKNARVHLLTREELLKAHPSALRGQFKYIDVVSQLILSPLEKNIRRAIIYRQLKEYDQALAQLQEAEKGYAGNSDLQLQFALTYVEKSDWAHARDYFERVLKALPRHPIANFYMGQFAYEAGQYREATNFLTIAATSAEWHKRAAPIRKAIQEKVLGKIEPLDVSKLAEVVAETTQTTASQFSVATPGANAGVTSTTTITTTR